jgi:hypothetical protein
MKCGGKNLGVLKSRTLCTPFGNETTLVALNRAVRIHLDLENPTRTQWFDIWRAVYHFLSAIGHQGVDSLLSSAFPVHSVRPIDCHAIGSGLIHSTNKLDHREAVELVLRVLRVTNRCQLALHLVLVI